jgi:hypothetical protein
MKQLFSVLMSLHLILAPVAVSAAEGLGMPTEGAAEQFRSGEGGKNGGVDFYSAQVLTLSTGIIGSTILTKCVLGTTQPSILVFMGGSLGMIAKEILGGKTQGNFHQQRISDLKMLEDKMKGEGGGDYQKAALDAALADEKNNRDFIKKRKIWMMAITTIFYTATALALWEFALSKSPAPKPDNGLCQVNEAGDALLTKLLVGAYNMGNSRSGGGKISQYGGMAMSVSGNLVASKFEPLLLGAVSTNNKKIKIYDGGLGRSIAFGASAALSTAVTMGLARRQNVVENNISTMEKVLKSFKEKSKTSDGIKKDETLANETKKNKDQKKYEIKALAEGTLPKHCFSASKGGMDYSPESCKNPIKMKKPQWDINMNLPTLTSAANAAHDFGNALASGDMAQADLAAGNLAAMAGRVKEVKDNLIKQIDKQLEAKGEKPLQLEKAINERVASLQADMQKAAAAQGVKLASGEAELTPETNKDKKDSASAVASAPVQEVGTGLPEMNFNFAEEAGSGTGDAEMTASLDESLKDYESNEADILKKPEVSIFKQLSNRYLLNYTKIFEDNNAK